MNRSNRRARNVSNTLVKLSKPFESLKTFQDVLDFERDRDFLDLKEARSIRTRDLPRISRVSIFESCCEWFEPVATYTQRRFQVFQMPPIANDSSLVSSCLLSVGLVSVRRFARSNKISEKRGLRTWSMRGGERDPCLPARATSVRLEDEIVRVAAVFGHFYRPFLSAIFIKRFYRSARDAVIDERDRSSYAANRSVGETLPKLSRRENPRSR